MNYNKIRERFSDHYCAMQGKKKFIDYFLNGDLQRNIIPSTQNMQCKFYDTPLGDITEYITLRTPTFGTNYIRYAKDTGDIPLKVWLGYHLVNANDEEKNYYWYYNATRIIDARKLPQSLYNYLLRKLQYSDPRHHVIGTHMRAYSSLVDSYDEVLEVIRNDYEYRNELVFYEQSNGKSVHPQGNLIRVCPDPDAILKYDDVYPELSEDALFNIQLQGISESDVLSQLRKIQYLASVEIRYNTNSKFCHMCNDIL